MVFGSTFLAGAFLFWGKHDLKKNVVLGVGIPSMGFSLGKHDLEKAVVFGSAFLAGALVFLAKPNKTVVFGVGVPSRDFCFLGKTCPEKSHGARGRRS